MPSAPPGALPTSCGRRPSASWNRLPHARIPSKRRCRSSSRMSATSHPASGRQVRQSSISRGDASTPTTRKARSISWRAIRSPGPSRRALGCVGSRRDDSPRNTCGQGRGTGAPESSLGAARPASRPPRPIRVPDLAATPAPGREAVRQALDNLLPPPYPCSLRTLGNIRLLEIRDAAPWPTPPSNCCAARSTCSC